MIINFIKHFLYTNFYTALDRYFYTQLFSNYLIGLSFFSSITMINELYYIMRYYFEQNVPLQQVLSMMGALIPFLVSFSVPFAVLPAYLLLFGKLSQDSEIVSMRACGISHFRIMWPGTVFGIMTMLISYNFKNYVEAPSNAYFLQLKAKILAQKPVVQLLDNVFLNIGDVQISFESNSSVVGGDDILHTVYAVDVKNRRTIRAKQARIYVNPDNPEHYIMRFLEGDMNQLTISNVETFVNPDANTIPEVSMEEEIPHTPIIIEAPLDVGKELVDPLPERIDGVIEEPLSAETLETNAPQQTIIQKKEEFYLSSFGAMSMNNYVWLPGDGYFRGPETLSYRELKDSIETLPQNIQHKKEFETAKTNKIVIDKLAFYVRWLPFLFDFYAEDPEDKLQTQRFIAMQKNRIFTEKQNMNSRYLAARAKLPNIDQMRLYEKFMLPVSAFVFAVLCLPLGMFSARSGRGEGLSLSLVVVLIFYGLKSGAENMITRNILTPGMIWMPTVLFGIVALIVYTRKILE